MKKILCLLLALSLLLSMTACQVEESPAPVESEVTDTPESPPKEYESAASETGLYWVTGVDSVQYEITWTVEGTTEAYVRELTDAKYQGRAGGSEGNRLAADWIAEQFERIGLQQLPTLGDWKQNYSTVTTAVLDGKASLVAPDGTETELKLGEDWVFRASPEALDVTVVLSTDETLYEDGKAIWDAYEQPKNSSKKLSLTMGDPSDGIGYRNSLVYPTRIKVTEIVYEQLKQEGYQIHLILPDAVDEDGNADNVVAYLPGQDSTKAVVLGANFDGTGQCGPLLMPSAYNNASGVATLIQTAAWLAQCVELPCDVIFAAFNTEDNREKGSAALSEHIKEQYAQIRMVNLKCIGWKGQPLTIYGARSNATLRNSLAGGLELQYADRDVGSDELAFAEENMSSVSVFQDACLNDEKASSVLSSTRDIADNLDFAMLDDLAKRLAEWVIERGGEPLTSYVVYW